MLHVLRGWMIVLLLTVTGAVLADPPERVARLAFVEGDVSMRTADSDGWQPAPLNRPLTTGDEIATDPDGRAEIRIGSSALRLDRLTTVEIRRLDDDEIRVRLIDGRIALHIRSAEPFAAIHVETRYGLVAPLAPGRYELGYDDPELWLASREGALNFRADDADVVVGERRLAFVGFSDHTEIAWAELAEDAFSVWARGRDERDVRLGDSSHVSPEMTGYEDLYEHGEWHESTEYGALWYPRTVPPGWAPYRFGRWASVAPWGWTWIDDAPWGFAPFHYGRWVWIQGRWGWTPGRYVARPVYAPALVVWLGGRDFAVGLSSGAVPSVGWFPLGPREVFVPPYRHGPKHLRRLNIGHAHAAEIERKRHGETRFHPRHRDRRDAATFVRRDVLLDSRPVPPHRERIDDPTWKRLGPGSHLPPVDARRVVKRDDSRRPDRGAPNDRADNLRGAARHVAAWPPDTSRERLDELREQTREADEIRRQRMLREQRQWLDQRQQQERFELRERSMRSREHDLDRPAERERLLEEHRRERLENERRFDDRMREQDFERRQLMRRQFERQQRDIDAQRHRFIERQRLEQRRRGLIDPRRDRIDLERQMFRPPQAHPDRSPPGDRVWQGRAEDRRFGDRGRRLPERDRHFERGPRFDESRRNFGGAGRQFGADGGRSAR